VKKPRWTFHFSLAWKSSLFSIASIAARQRWAPNPNCEKDPLFEPKTTEKPCGSSHKFSAQSHAHTAARAAEISASAGMTSKAKGGGEPEWDHLIPGARRRLPLLSLKSCSPATAETTRTRTSLGAALASIGLRGSGVTHFVHTPREAWDPTW